MIGYLILGAGIGSFITIIMSHHGRARDREIILSFSRIAQEAEDGARATQCTFATYRAAVINIARHALDKGDPATMRDALKSIILRVT